MAKWIILSLLILSLSGFAAVDAHARRSSYHSHSHARGPSFNFRFPLPSYRSHSRQAQQIPVYYKKPINQQKERPLPRVYTVQKPLIDDARIYRPLVIRKQKSYQPDFYRYDKENDQYFAPNLLHVGGKFVLTRRSIPIEINGNIFYYNDGFFYKELGQNFVVVSPVINSIVKTIPRARTSVGTAGHYEHNGIYYKRVPQGYQVIEMPEII